MFVVLINHVSFSCLIDDIACIKESFFMSSREPIVIGDSDSDDETFVTPETSPSVHKR